MTSDSIDIPSLNEIEKKIKLCQYTSIHLFAQDVRKVWRYYFSMAGTKPELYQKTFDISQYFEEIFNEAEEGQIESNSIEHLNNKIKKIETKLNEKIMNPHNLYLANAKSNTSTLKQPPVPITDRPMTITEKNILGNKIRGQEIWKLVNLKLFT